MYAAYNEKWVYWISKTKQCSNVHLCKSNNGILCSALKATVKVQWAFPNWNKYVRIPGSRTVGFITVLVCDATWSKNADPRISPHGFTFALLLSSRTCKRQSYWRGNIGAGKNISLVIVCIKVLAANRQVLNSIIHFTAKVTIIIKVVSHTIATFHIFLPVTTL